MAACRPVRDEPHVEVDGPSFTLTRVNSRAEYIVHACVLREPPEEGLVVDVEADVRLAEGTHADVALYVEMGDAAFGMEDGDRTVSTVTAAGTAMKQLTGMSTDAPMFESWCVDGLDVTFELIEGSGRVEGSWMVAVSTVGGFVDTELEVRIGE